MNGVSFGKYISRIRAQKAMSQRQLADKAGVTNSTISRIEADSVNPDFATIEKLASALHVEKTVLLSKCASSDIPEEFVVIARKVGDLTQEQRSEVYRAFNETIDQFLLSDNEEE